MCWFVTAGVAEKSVAALERALAEHGCFRCDWLLPAPTGGAFAAGTRCVQLTRGGCSCDLYMPKSATDPRAADRDKARMRAKGWSAAKIERALAARRESDARPEVPTTGQKALRDVVASVVGAVGAIHLHAHFRNGSEVEDNSVPIATVVVPLPEFLVSGFPPDTIATIS